MSKYSVIIKKSLLLIVFVVILMPIAQNNLSLFLVKDLKGSFQKTAKIDFSFDYWYDGVFQETCEKFLNENFGFRNTLVRFNNQIIFDLFKKSTNKEAVFGKDGYIFAEEYVKSYIGKNYIGQDLIVEKSIKVKKLQLKLLEKGIVFVPILAPNKARILSEYLPENTPKYLSNYEAYVYCFKRLGITYIDFNDYFIKNNKISKLPLYSKYGIHWSSYGRTIAADSIINFLNYKYSLNTPCMSWKNNILMSDSLMDLDYDIGEGMNLLVNQLPSEKLAYPKIEYVKNENSKPPLLVIGDSFNFGLDETDMQNKVFSNYKFLYYYKELIPYTDDKEAFYKLNIKDEIFNHKVITLVATEHNLVNFGWGFIEQALDILEGKNDGTINDYERKIKLMVEKIKQNPEWYKQVVDKSISGKISLDSALILDAKYVIDLEKKENINSDFNEKVKDMKEYIKKDLKWIEKAKKTALEKNISVDSVITSDAIWEVKQGK